MNKHIRTCLFVLISVICVAPTAFSQIDTVSIFRSAIEARNRGDLDGMMQFFAQDAVREDGSCQPPCVGVAAVKRSMEINIADHFRADLTVASRVIISPCAAGGHCPGQRFAGRPLLALLEPGLGGGALALTAAFITVAAVALNPR